jgi:hypothetical protein
MIIIGINFNRLLSLFISYQVDWHVTIKIKIYDDRLSIINLTSLKEYIVKQSEIKQILQHKFLFIIRIKRPKDKVKKAVIIPKANITGGTPDELYHFVRNMIREHRSSLS